MRLSIMEQFIRRLYQSTNWRPLSALTEWVLEEAIRIQQIPAPTFHEDGRTHYIAQQFDNFQLDRVRTDDAKNTFGLLQGSSDKASGILLMAHTDTVFPVETDLSIRRENGKIFGPGLGDNSVAVAAMLGLIKWLREENITPACNLWFVATSCEEGLGDLKGSKAAFAFLKDKIRYVLNLEGLAFGHIYHAGIAVHRLHIKAKAEGGHSWLHFGRPSAVHGILELGTKITQLQPKETPRTTFNVGMIDGGQTINAIGTNASLWLDLRSESQIELDAIKGRVHQLIESTQQPGLTFDTEVVGNRPAGAIDIQHPLVQGAVETLKLLGVNAMLETGSTDANIPLANGYPAITIGITRGGNAHRLDEFIEVAPIRQGLQQLFILAQAAARYQTSQVN